MQNADTKITASQAYFLVRKSVDFIYIYIYSYAAMCPASLQDAVRSHQVHQLILGTNVGSGFPNAI